MSGAHRAALDNSVMIREDATRASILTTITVAILMMLACRRRWLALLGLTPVLFGALGTMIVLYLTENLVAAVALITRKVVRVARLVDVLEDDPALLGSGHGNQRFFASALI